MLFCLVASLSLRHLKNNIFPLLFKYILVVNIKYFVAFGSERNTLNTL